MSATTSPGWTSRSTRSSATTPGKRLLMPRICRMGEDIRQKAEGSRRRAAGGGFTNSGSRRRAARNVPTAFCFLPSAFFDLRPAAELVDLFDEVVHVVLLDDARGDENLLGRGDHRAVAAFNLRHHLHGLVAELVGLLDDCPLDEAVLDALERVVFLVEGDDLDLAGLARVLDGAEDRRAFVGPEAAHRRHFGVLDDGVGRVRLGAHAVGVVRAHVYDLDVGAGYRLLDAFEPLARVLRVGLADEDHDLAALRQGRLDEFAGLAARGAVVRADVAGAVALRRVRVLRDDEDALGRVVDHLRLVRGVDGADRHAVNALGEQVVNDALLLGGGAVRRDAELHVHVVEFLVGLLRPPPRDG